MDCQAFALASSAFIPRDASLTRRVQAACRIFEYNKILKQALFSSASFAAHPLNPLDVAPRNFELRVRFFPKCRVQ
jgi:hypothetical protein